MENTVTAEESTKLEMTKNDFKTIVLEDYKLANVSRETSLLGRREVLTGKAKIWNFWRW